MVTTLCWAWPAHDCPSGRCQTAKKPSLVFSAKVESAANTMQNKKPDSSMATSCSHSVFFLSRLKGTAARG